MEIEKSINYFSNNILLQKVYVLFIDKYKSASIFLPKIKPAQTNLIFDMLLSFILPIFSPRQTY